MGTAKEQILSKASAAMFKRGSVALISQRDGIFLIWEKTNKSQAVPKTTDTGKHTENQANTYLENIYGIRQYKLDAKFDVAILRHVIECRQKIKSKNFHTGVGVCYLVFQIISWMDTSVV